MVKPALLPKPQLLKLHSESLTLNAGMTYQGPTPGTAFRLLHSACAANNLHFDPAATAAGALVVRADIAPRQTTPGDYQLVIEKSGIDIRAADSAGIRHALVTLSQLITQFGSNLPLGVIEDRPAFPVRGLMLDVSRCRVPTMAQLFATVDTLEMLKMNHLQLYMEHTFAYTRHESVWSNASPITADEIRELDTYCAARGIELSANQNTLGHMQQWLHHDRYAPLAEIVDANQSWSFQTPFGNEVLRKGPFSLCPTNPAAIEFASGLLAELLPHFSSPHANIGCDEAHDIGQGKSRNAVARDGYAAVYSRYVHVISLQVQQLGKTPMIWADMALKFPKVLDMIDPETTLLAWGYESDHNFAAPSHLLREKGFQHWVCPGTSAWRSITGRCTNCTANIAAAASQNGQAEGLLVCEWGDEGHRQLWPISLLSLCKAAQAAWSGNLPQSTQDQT